MNDTPLSIGGMEIQPGFYIDGYRYDSPIGHGGMAEVLLAYDPSNRPFAIKVLKANRFKAGRRRFSREFRTLSKMHHPNVIEVDSYGDVYGHPYIAMEYIQGSDLHKEIRGFRERSLNDRWTRVRQILIDLSKGLEHIHSHGVVHRDLKPSNILVDSDGRCVITDFGIVKELNSDVEKSTALVGTWAYASPEQITGQELDHRSDLYSLGVILYAMLCSRRPFAASNMAGYSKLHSEQPPRAPSNFIPEIPTIFEDICLKLLEKSPQDRFQSAREILVALGEVQGQKAVVENMVDQIPFFKKDLSVDFIRTIQQRPRAVTVIQGEQGFGKSKILEGLEHRLQSLHLPYVRIRISKNATPFEGGGQLIQHIAKESGDETLHRLWLRSTEASSATDYNILAQLTDRAHSVLRSLLEERAQVILIDDLHGAQTQSSQLFHTLWEQLALRLNLPLFFFVTSTEETRLFREADVLPLRPINVDDIISILSQMTEEQEGLDIIARKILEETEGIPLFLNAFIQQLIEERILIRQDSKYRFTKAPQVIADQNFNIAPSIRETVWSRLETVSPEEMDLLKILAVAGREVHIDLILHLSNLADDPLFDSLDNLQKKRLTLERKNGLDEYIRLRRQKYGSVLYDSLSAEERTTIHSKIAHYLESTQSLHNINIVQQLGNHFRRGDIPEKAFQYLALAAVRLWDRGLKQNALQQVDYATPLTKLAKQRLIDSQFSEARLRLLQVSSAYAHNQGEWREGLKLLKTQLRYAKTLKQWKTITQTKLSIGDIHSRLGELDKAKVYFHEVLDESRKHNHRLTQVEAYYQLCGLEWDLGHTQEALSYAQQGLDLTEPNENCLPKAKILLSISSVRAHLGQLSVASEQMRTAASILRELSQKELLGIVLCNHAELLLWRGLWVEAHEQATESLQLATQSLYQMGQAHTRYILAKIAMERGSYSTAIEQAKASQAIASQLNIESLHAVTTFVLGQIQLELGNPNAALKLLDIAINGMHSNDPEQHLIATQLVRVLALIYADKKTEAIMNLQNLRPHLTDGPRTRQMENKYWLARIDAALGNIDQAIQLCVEEDLMAEQMEVWGWSIKFKALLLNLSSNPQCEVRFYQLFDQLGANLSESERAFMLDHIQYIHD